MKIFTDHLLLVPIALNYRDDIFHEFTEEVALYLNPQPTGDVKDTENFINDSLNKNFSGEGLQLVALDKDTLEFLGCLGLHQINTPIPELGLWFKKSVWGRGYGKESMAALKRWADDNLDYKKIRYPVFKANISSRKIAEFLGGELTREFIGENQKGQKREELEYFIERGQKNNNIQTN